MSQMDYNHNRSRKELEKLPSTNLSRQKLKKNPYLFSSPRAISARSNQLPKILKDYQQFCLKHFNSNYAFPQSTGHDNQQSFSMSNQDSQSPHIDTSTIDLGFLNDSPYDFIPNPLIIPNDTLNKLELKQNNNKSLGNHKNNKNDYEQRLKRLTSSKDTDKYEEEDFNFKDELDLNKHNKGFSNNPYTYNDEESNEHEKNINEKDNNDSSSNKDNEVDNKVIKIFDESTHKIIDQEMRNQYATKIQIYFKAQRDHKRGRDRIYLNYDKTMKYIVFIYTNKRSTLISKGDYNIFSLIFKVFSFETHAVTYHRKEIKELCNSDEISYKQIKDVLPEMIDKILKYENEKKAIDNNKTKEEKIDEDNAYDDDDFGGMILSEKIINNDIHQSISSIDRVEYDNI